MAVDLVALKTSFEALSFKDAVDPDGLLEKVKELRGDLSDGNSATPEFLHAVFKAMGIEQVIEEPAPAEGEGGEEKGEGEGEEGEGEGDAAEGDGDGEGKGEGEGEGEEGGEDGEGGEGEKEAEPAPPPEPKYTNFAGELFTLLDTNGSGVINVSDLVTIVNLITKGYGEAALRFATTAFDLENKGTLNEEELFAAIRWSASSDLTPMLMTHLRRLWRQVDKSGSGAAVRANVESFFEKLGEDEFLSAALTTEKAIEPPQPEGGEEEEEDE